jgi:hypothetical protein
VSCKVIDALHARPAILPQNIGYGVALIGTVLKEQGAVYRQDFSGVFGNLPDRIQSVGTGCECQSRLVPEFIKRRIVIAHIRWV